MSILQEFCAAMAQAGLSPYDAGSIKADNKRHNYRLYDDPPSKKRGYYKLKIDGDFGFGFFGDWRGNECFSWHSKSESKYSRNELYILREAARIEAEKERERILELRKEKAREARDFLLFLNPCPPDHPYLVKKGIRPHGASVENGRIILPMQINGEVWNYQSIEPDGTKIYLKDALVAGCSYVIAGDKAKICVVEGFATGASVHEATGFETHVAFNAGNLVHVIGNLLAKHKKEDILLCADNDHETIVRGEPYNTGFVKAKIILEKYGVNYVYPEFKEPAGKTDFNDLALAEGLDAVRNIIQRKDVLAADSMAGAVGLEAHRPPLVHAPASHASPYNDDFERDLIKNSKGIDARSTTNAFLIAVNDPPLRGIYQYDSFSKQILLTKPAPWNDEKDFKVRPIADYDYLPLECYLESAWGIKTSKSRCADLIERIATLEQHTFNPASEHFNSLQWDGTPRLDTWLKKYVANDTQGDDYLSIVGRKFVCGLAARAMIPGIKFDTMLILEGPQYAGKSYLSRIMSTINGVEYFLDDFKDIENKDALMKMQGKLVVEFPEISTLRKAEVNDLKAFITRQTDEFRPPYGRNVRIAPRQCVFVGTVNPEGPYFKDVTGNRRYWPVSCRDRIAIDELKKIMPMLHAEAAHLVKSGEKLWLSNEEYSVAQAQQDMRVIIDLWTDKIEEFLKGVDAVSSDDLAQHLEIPLERRSPMVFSRLNQVMSKLGWIPARVTILGKQKRGFRKTKSAISGSFDEEIKW